MFFPKSFLTQSLPSPNTFSNRVYPVKCVSSELLRACLFIHHLKQQALSLKTDVSWWLKTKTKLLVKSVRDSISIFCLFGSIHLSLIWIFLQLRECKSGQMYSTVSKTKLYWVFKLEKEIFLRLFVVKRKRSISFGILLHFYWDWIRTGREREVKVVEYLSVFSQNHSLTEGSHLLREVTKLWTKNM